MVLGTALSSDRGRHGLNEWFVEKAVTAFFAKETHPIGMGTRKPKR